MDEVVKKVLRKNYEELQSIQLTPRLIAELYARGVITKEQRDRLQGESNMEKINLLLEVLPYRGPVAFGLFVDALRKDHSYTASKLEADFKEKKSDALDQTRPDRPEDEGIYKSWLTEQWEFLKHHLIDHRSVSDDDRNFRTISLDSMGNLIKMTVQMYKMCKTKLEEKNSTIRELTKEKEEFKSELLIAQNEIEVSEYNLQRTKQLLNQRNEEIADLRQMLSVTPSPGARVPGSN